MSAARKSAGCKCADKVDAELQAQGARLTVAIKLNGEAFAVVATHRVKKGVKLKTLVATFCPFCGKEYPR